MRLSILFFLIFFLTVSFIFFSLAGHVRSYAPHEGLFLRAQVRQVQIGLVSKGLLAAIYEYAHYSDEVPTPQPDPLKIIYEVVDSMGFASCVEVEHESGKWQTGGECRTYYEEFSYELPDGSLVKIKISVVSHKH